MTSQHFSDLGLAAKNESAGCACCSPAGGHGTHGAAAEELTITPGAVESVYQVEGMTCGHCVASVTEEVSEIDGVLGVNVDLRVGGLSTVTVSSAAAIDAQRVREAVEEAGYHLASA